MNRPNLLIIHIEEPTSNPSQPSTHHLLADNLLEAERRYRTLITVMISQLTGLEGTHIRFIVSPADLGAIEAVTFWMLPLFRGEVIKHGDKFQFTPEQHAPKFFIEFTNDADLPTHEYEKIAHLSAHCPECGARWINAGMIQCNATHEVSGKEYLNIQHRSYHHEPTTNGTSIKLPFLPLIHTDADWHHALAIDSPISLKLKKHYEMLCDD